MGSAGTQRALSRRDICRSTRCLSLYNTKGILICSRETARERAIFWTSVGFDFFQKSATFHKKTMTHNSKQRQLRKDAANISKVLGRVDGFDKGEGERESDDGTMVLRGLLASIPEECSTHLWKSFSHIISKELPNGGSRNTGLQMSTPDAEDVGLQKVQRC